MEEVCGPEVKEAVGGVMIENDGRVEQMLGEGKGRRKLRPKSSQLYTSSDSGTKFEMIKARSFAAFLGRSDGLIYHLDGSRRKGRKGRGKTNVFSRL